MALCRANYGKWPIHWMQINMCSRQSFNSFARQSIKRWTLAVKGEDVRGEARHFPTASSCRYGHKQASGNSFRLFSFLYWRRRRCNLISHLSNSFRNDTNWTGATANMALICSCHRIRCLLGGRAPGWARKEAHTHHHSYVTLSDLYINLGELRTGKRGCLIKNTNENSSLIDLNELGMP